MAQEFTLQEMIQMGGKPVSQPQVQPQQGYTLQQLQAMGAKPADQTQSGSMNPVTNTVDAASSGISQIKSGFDQTKQGANNPDMLAGAQQIGRGILNEGAGVVNTATAPIAGAIKSLGNLPGISEAVDAIKQHVIDPTANKISDSSALQHFMVNNPHADEVVGNLLTVLPAVLGGAKVSGAVGDAVESVGNSVKSSIDGVTDTAQQGLKKAFPGINATPNEVTTQVAKDWLAPTEINNASYNAARKVLTKTPEIPQFLTENGVSPWDHIESGKYSTTDISSQMRDTPMEMSNKMLRPALEIADYTTPKTSVQDIINQAVKSVETDTSETPDAIESMVSKMQAKGASLERKYPDGMSLTDMHDSKLAYSSKSGYSPIGDPAANVEATANRHLGDAFRSEVENKAPVDLPVHQFNDYLSKFYKSADYLDALNNKKAPVTLGQTVARTLAKGAGLLTGKMMGGGIVTEFLNYQIAKAIEGSIENMTNPMRAEALSKLQRTSPEAYTQVKSFLEKKAANSQNILKLPGGNTPGSEGNPIITPAPSEDAQMRSRARTILDSKNK